MFVRAAVTPSIDQPVSHLLLSPAPVEIDYEAMETDGLLSENGYRVWRGLHRDWRIFDLILLLVGAPLCVNVVCTDRPRTPPACIQVDKDATFCCCCVDHFVTDRAIDRLSIDESAGGGAKRRRTRVEVAALLLLAGPPPVSRQPEDKLRSERPTGRSIAVAAVGLAIE
uniref:Uncharacterized protein n=1 Tax=Peronospora matthiolae TaxID=2874970 RepID=A0AAV1VM86_9STRA